jgi:predicted membrane protein
MKMSATLIIGIVLILLGLSALIKVIFNIDFPIFKIAFAALFIFIGIRMLTGNSISLFHGQSDEYSVIFGEKTVNSVKDGKEYNVIFGAAVYDFTHLELEPGTNTNIKLNTIFGGSKLILTRDMPVRINANSVFGGTSMPNGDNSVFGSAEYKNDTIPADSIAHLIIETNTIFGGLKVVKQ